MDSLSFKENTEYKIMLGKLRLDRNIKKLIAAYHPLNTYVEKLIDNYAQARDCMTRMDGRLIKTRRIEEFNRQFYDNVDWWRGGGGIQMAHQRREGMYIGPVNCITMVELLKQGLTPQPP
jgi:hypothetical protein